MCGESDIEQTITALVQAHKSAVRETYQEAIKTLEHAQMKMRPMILLDQPEGQNFAMYWDDQEQVWNRARYADLIAEAKRQLRAAHSGKGGK